MKSDAPDDRPMRAELMDDPALGLAETERALTDLDRVTHWSGGLLPVLHTLAPRLVAGPRRQSLLDLGTGSGLVPARVTSVAARSRVSLLAVGCDRKLSHLLYGRRQGHRQLRVVARAEELPFADGAFDWSLSTLLLHHFDRTRNRLVLAEMRRVARAGAVVIDLRRSRVAPLLFRPLAALLRIGPVACYDGMVSLEQAWTKAEVERLAAGMPVLELRRRFPFRFSLVVAPPT
ncbi:MAG: methyltransferase domain-containing protein [Thermoanaerobaculia bacterium]